ncbi:MAG: ABC transporter permease [Bacteroidota bacterium]|nr:ABC transporter permease [Bacteroidota bacterium]
MRRFISFLKKEFRHIFRDTRTMLILFGIPAAQLLLFGFVIKNEVKNISVAVWNMADDEVSRELTHKIFSSGLFNRAENIHSKEGVSSALRSGKAQLVIAFETNFSEHFHKEKSADIQLIADAADANTANLIVQYTSAIIGQYVQEQNSELDLPMQITTETRMLYNEELADVYMFVPGIAAMILMLISAMMTSISVAAEKERGSMEVILVSPLKPIQIILGKVSPYFVLSFANAVIILLMAYFIFDMPINGSITLLMAETMLFILLALSLGILISTVAANQQVAMMMSMFALLLPTILLSGFIFPIENMPEILQYFATLMPPKYYIIILKNIMLKGTDFTFIWKETLILVGMTLFFVAMSAKKFKIRLE